MLLGYFEGYSILIVFKALLNYITIWVYIESQLLIIVTANILNIRAPFLELSCTFLLINNDLTNETTLI